MFALQDIKLLIVHWFEYCPLAFLGCARRWFCLRDPFSAPFATPRKLPRVLVFSSPVAYCIVVIIVLLNPFPLGASFLPRAVQRVGNCGRNKWMKKQTIRPQLNARYIRNVKTIKTPHDLHFILITAASSSLPFSFVFRFHKNNN